MNIKQKGINPLVFLTVFSALILFVAVFFSNSTTLIKPETPQHLNTGWVYIENDRTIAINSLPEDLGVEKNEPVTIEKTLSDDFHNKQTLLIRTSLQVITIKIDNNIIYHHDFEQATVKTYASLWHLVDIPEHSEGKTISITLTSPYKAMSGVINPISYGYSTQLKDFIFTQYGYRLLVTIFVFTASIIVMITSILFLRHNQRNTYLAAFGLLLSFWIFAESRMMQSFTDNEFIIGSLAYLSLAALPIPLLIYVKKYLIDRYYKIYHFFCVLSGLNFITIFLFHVFGIFSFFDTVIASQLIIIIAMLSSLTLLYVDLFKHKNKRVKAFVFLISFLFFFVMMELVNFLIGTFQLTSIFALIGISLIIAFTLVNYLVALVKIIKRSYEKEVYRKMAYTDILTGAANRTAFEEDIEKLFQNKKTNFLLILFDVDDLKWINDTHGHIEGDVVLKDAYNIMMKSFGSAGKCYRIGGDEFTCLIDQERMMDIYQDLLIKFNELIANYNLDSKYKIHISHGYSAKNVSTDVKPSDMMKRADQKMYLEKRQKKSILT